MYVSRKTPGNLEGTRELWGTIVCATKYIYIYFPTINVLKKLMGFRHSYLPHSNCL